VQGVARDQLGLAAGAFGAGLDLQPEGRVRPLHRRHWQVAFAQGGGAAALGLHLGPAPHAAMAVDHQRLDGRASALRLDGAVFGQQRTVRPAAVHTHQRPVVLLAVQGARMVAAGGRGGRGLERGIAVEPFGGRGRLQIQHAARPGDAHIARLLLGQPQRLRGAPAGRQAVQRAPLAAVVAGLHSGRAVRGGAGRPAPVQA